MSEQNGKEAVKAQKDNNLKYMSDVAIEQKQGKMESDGEHG